jgi:hypothetical protein
LAIACSVFAHRWAPDTRAATHAGIASPAKKTIAARNVVKSISRYPLAVNNVSKDFLRGTSDSGGVDQFHRVGARYYRIDSRHGQDPSGAVDTDATVTITNTDTGVRVRTVKTNGYGETSSMGHARPKGA